MTISNEVVQAVLDAWRKFMFPCCFCFDFSCDLLLARFSALFFDVWFWIGLHLFLRVLFSPALVLHFCLVFMDLILRFFVAAALFPRLLLYHCLCFLFLITLHLHLPHLLYCYFLLSFLPSPSFFPFHQKHTIPNLLLLRNSNFHPRRSTHPPRIERSSQETFLRFHCPWSLFHHHWCQEIRS